MSKPLLTPFHFPGRTRNSFRLRGSRGSSKSLRVAPARKNRTENCGFPEGAPVKIGAGGILWKACFFERPILNSPYAYPVWHHWR